MCIFESDPVKSECPMQENYEIFKDFKQTVGLLYYVVLHFVLEILKKQTQKNSENEKKSFENDQSPGHFQSFFFLFFFLVPPTLNLKKNSHKSTNKKIWPKYYFLCVSDNGQFMEV